MAELLEYLSPQGLPPFGSLLLAISATTPNGTAQLKEMYVMLLKNDEDYVVSNTIDAADEFLSLLTQLPPKYKQGNNRFLLFQTIFENCHNMLSSKKAKLCITVFKKQSREIAAINFSKSIFHKDFNTISLLHKRFPTVESIIEKMASLPKFDEKELILEENEVKEAKTKDFITELTEREKTFHVGALIPRIWGGLNIPVHSALPSQQPLGGISDLTNKGDFDRLLLSEFANDDLLFLSRLANNEALFIQREIPPINQNLQRIILIDVTIKNWGTPKIVAFATMLAIAKHPKTNIECSAYVLGDTYTAIDISSVDGIIEGLQKVNANLHAVNGLGSFFNDFSADKSREIFILTNPSTLKQTAMLKAMNDYHHQINYWIYTDAEGNIDVYKKQQNSKKHLQHLNLPLEKLWTREVKKDEPKEKKAVEELPKKLLTEEGFPILFPMSRDNKAIFSLPDKSIFLITSKRALFEHHGDIGHGWDMVVKNLPIGSGQFAMGLTSVLEPLLLMFNPNDKKVILLNIRTKHQYEIDFPHWGKRGQFSFSEDDEMFYYTSTKGYWKISPYGEIEACNTMPNYSIFEKKSQDFSLLRQQPNYSIFRNVTEVAINQEDNLAFNRHALYFSAEYNSFTLSSYYWSESKIKAKKSNSREAIFEFSEGSTVEINPDGMLILRSSNPSIPTIYVPAIVHKFLGVATQEHFAGELYYYKYKLSGQEKISVGDFYTEYIKAFIENISTF